MSDGKPKMNWNDQPAFDHFNSLACIWLTHVHVQVADVVYKGKNGVAVTAGNLFGSSTILVPTHRQAFIAIEKLSELAQRRAENPKLEEQIKASDLGGEFIPNTERGGKREEAEV